MLKIKDNVDLKELEKFGFVQWNNKYCCRDYLYIYDCNRHSTIKIIVRTDRTLRIVNTNNKVINVLYDLIKDDLIEKVEG